MCRVSTYWTEELYNKFVTMALLNEEEARIMDMLIKKYTIKEMAKEVKLSTSTVSRRINMLRGKYDNLVKLYPDIFPERHSFQIPIERR